MPIGFFGCSPPAGPEGGGGCFLKPKNFLSIYERNLFSFSSCFSIFSFLSPSQSEKFNLFAETRYFEDVSDLF